MWRPWSKALELLGRIGFRFLFSYRRKLSVGDPAAPDARGTQGWRGYLRSDRLYDVWGPHPHGPWVPFHCVPLFAALDRIHQKEIGPTRPRELRDADATTTEPEAGGLPAWVRPDGRAPAWLTGEVWTILDLPGPVSVEAAAWLVTSAGCQPVCTFDNWPHPRGVLRAENTLAELLRWATTIGDARPRLTPTSPPLWICDSERLGTRKGRAGEFDNRYYLDDSILPGPEMLRRNGIRRAVYVTLGATEVPVTDLEAYFSDLLKGGIAVRHIDLLDALAAEPQAFLSASKKPRKPPRSGFHRSGAGGFGTEIPEASSGGSGG
jgi:hypothetical protein